MRSLARPGGNITGVSDLADEATVKRLELAKAALPKATRVALLTNPDFPATARIEARVEAAARLLGVRDLVFFIEAVARVMRSKTTTVPIVLTFSSDSVGTGLAQSLARPGGNVIGVATLAQAIGVTPPQPVRLRADRAIDRGNGAGRPCVSLQP